MGWRNRERIERIITGKEEPIAKQKPKESRSDDGGLNPATVEAFARVWRMINGQ